MQELSIFFLFFPLKFIKESKKLESFQSKVFNLHLFVSLCWCNVYLFDKGKHLKVGFFFSMLLGCRLHFALPLGRWCILEREIWVWQTNRLWNWQGQPQLFQGSEWAWKLIFTDSYWEHLPVVLQQKLWLVLLFTEKK